jgi:2-polyprenyl-3-methyl-5-hydroxy-6-metoxy-1,4-benzoquinol methylase
MVVTDHSITGESFAISKCTKCEFVFTNPRPKITEIGKYYESDKYISHSNKTAGIIDAVYKVVRIWTTNQKIKLIKKYKKKGSVLDFGSGTGYFLNKINQAGYSSLGVEPNERAKLIAIKSHALTIKSSLKEIDLESKFDVITCWHVIEHVHELNETIKKLKNLLNKKGIIFIAIPNYKSYDAKYYREYWAGYDVPRHLYHFSQDTMNEIAKKHQFKIVKKAKQVRQI